VEKENLRKRIDEIDEQFIQLLEERLDIARAIGEEKKGQGLPILDMAREREILNRMAERAGDKNETYAKLVFSAILAASKNAQTHVYYKNEEKWEEKIAAAKKDAFPSRADVACQGTEGAYSQQACDKLFPMARILYSSTFEGVFKAVETGLCKYGILPIENSLAGSVSTVYDLMKKHKFYVVRSGCPRGRSFPIFGRSCPTSRPFPSAASFYSSMGNGRSPGLKIRRRRPGLWPKAAGRTLPPLPPAGVPPFMICTLSGKTCKTKATTSPASFALPRIWKSIPVPIKLV
jgi:monofunctional chorismate mutase